MLIVYLIVYLHVQSYSMCVYLRIMIIKIIMISMIFWFLSLLQLSLLLLFHPHPTLFATAHRYAAASVLDGSADGSLDSFAARGASQPSHTERDFHRLMHDSITKWGVQPYMLNVMVTKHSTVHPVCYSLPVLPMHEMFAAVCRVSEIQRTISLTGTQYAGGLQDFWSDALESECFRDHPGLGSVL